ncbi:MAG TPA: TonB-dependent receptor [Fermentimonas caenicola]|jgi:outer membrane receptor for ferrienterochelin and colicin|uniref:TonB-dependent receptor n=1 Tax=Lascolabacillus massiliensis TaxID=1627894 RepID=UPI0006B387B5|nr:TonB-dependent receptor [Lascolabacillus massiliensis]TAH60236.1 MAG: TonB-dependent receptor [Fermentimonas caenicola]HHU42375.1 TonB-dependent receptor [Fermentimonas caenicola]
MYKYLTTSLFLLVSLLTFAQTGTVKGRVYNQKNNEPLEFATIRIQGTTNGTTTDLEGNYEIVYRPGFYRLEVSYVGYETTLSAEVQIQGNQTAFIDIAVPESSTLIDEVVVRPTFNLKKIESPVSFLTIGVSDIEKAAGVNRDVSKALQSLPGVGATDPNRNDLIVRGGGPSENVFYLDGIEIPIINHFATQGSSGGVVGIINPDFVREVNFYTGAFPANRPNALSSVMDIRQKDGSRDRIHTQLGIGASDAAFTMDGPIGDKTTFIVSARQSYLQLLFKFIGLPFLPTYNDFQVKYKYQIDPKNELSIIGLGAIDNMTLNTDLQEDGTESQRYLLDYLPVYQQWNYTIGAVYKHFSDNYFDTWVLSRNMLRNKNFKYPDNDESQPKISDYRSDEAENKFRFERSYPDLPVKLLIGAGVAYSHYENETNRKVFSNGSLNDLIYNTKLDLWSYQAFIQASDTYLNNRLSLSLGLNTIGNNFNNNMKNPLNQVSPRFSASYRLTDKWDINANVGRYAMRPAYTTLGYKDASGLFINKNENLKHIISNQAIAGFAYELNFKLRFNLEGFYKLYNNYPLSVTDGMSIAGKGTDYGQVGDEEIVSTGKGRAYGIEFSGKLVDYKGLNSTITYTLFKSEFTGADGIYRPSNWDTRHMVNLLGSYNLPKNWNISMRWRFVGGAPYSPIDVDLSTNKDAWSVNNRPYIDYANYNTLRLKDSHQLDLRIDKEYYFKKMMLNFYLDVQNAYNFQSENPPIYTNKDASGMIMNDPSDPEKQLLRQLDSFSGTVLPAIGVMIKF